MSEETKSVEVSHNNNGLVILSHPVIEPREDGTVYLQLTPDEARRMGRVLIVFAEDCQTGGENAD